MKKVILIPVCLALFSCAWFQTNSKALSADALSTLSCVVSAAVSGMPVEEIGCGLTAIADVVNILDAAEVTPVSSPALTAYRLTQVKKVKVLTLKDAG